MSIQITEFPFKIYTLAVLKKMYFENLLPE